VLRLFGGSGVAGVTGAGRWGGGGGGVPALKEECLNLEVPTPAATSAPALSYPTPNGHGSAYGSSAPTTVTNTQPVATARVHCPGLQNQILELYGAVEDGHKVGAFASG
jgi:hypothetical protein